MIKNIAKSKWYKLGFALVLFIALLIAFAELLNEVREGSALLIDEEILRAINLTSTPLWDKFYLVMTDMGGLFFIAAMTTLVTTLLVRSGRRYLGTFVVIAVAGAGLISLTLKSLIGRERPSLWEQLISESSYSFPSGHAMGSSILALCIVLALWRTKFRWIAVALSSIYVLLVGYSRLYLGVHYPSDILAGWIVSCAWFMTVGVVLYRHAWLKKSSR